MDSLKITFSALATILALVGYIPYLIDMFRGKNQPHLDTWISIFVITAVVAYIQVIGGSGVGAVAVVVGVAVDAVILAYCFKYGTKDVVAFDKICLAISLVGVAAYVLFRDQPLVALAIVTVAELVAFVPTVRKTRNDPYSESLTSYYLIGLKLVFVLLALEAYNLLTVSYPALWLGVFAWFMTMVYVWRARSKRRGHRGSTDDFVAV